MEHLQICKVKILVTGMKVHIEEFIRDNLESDYFDFDSIVSSPVHLKGNELASWRYNNWGVITEPDCLEYKYSFDEHTKSDTITLIEIMFFSAYEIPRGVIRILSAMHPELKITMYGISNNKKIAEVCDYHQGWLKHYKRTWEDLYREQFSEENLTFADSTIKEKIKELELNI